MKLTRRTKFFYGLLVSGVFFLACECLLVIAGVEPALNDADPFVGFESSIPLFVEQTQHGREYLQTAANKLRYFNPQQFPKHKLDNTCRVFCVGGSTTFGRPYDDRTSFPGWLRELLPLADSSKHWEVINAGGISYASYRVANVVDELANYSPDLVVIYTGHNEFLEERSYGDLKASRPLLRGFTAPLFRTRSYSFAHRVLKSGLFPGQGRSILPAEVDAILDHSVGPEDYVRDDVLRSRVNEHFEFNLDRMIRVARSAGAEVVLVTPAANMKDFSPFKSEHAETLTADQRGQYASWVDAADAFEAEGQVDQALNALESAMQIDSSRADLHFRRGRLLFQGEQFVEARAAFQQAIENDICPLRASSAIQRSVEQAALEHHVPLVDFDRILQNACLVTHGHHSPGHEYFLDHVHPTASAHRLLALSIVQAMTLSGNVVPDPSWGEEAIASASRRVESRIDAELYARALTNLAQVLSWAGKQREAGPLAQRAVQLRSTANLREDPESMFYAAVHHATSGNDEQALALLARVVELEPDNAEARWRLATLLYDQGRFTAALPHFQAAVRADASNAYTFQMLGLTFSKLNQHDDAIAALKHAAALSPDHPGIAESMALVRNRKQLDQ